MGWFLFLKEYICRLDGVSLSVAVILYFFLSPFSGKRCTFLCKGCQFFLKEYLSQSKCRALPETDGGTNRCPRAMAVRAGESKCTLPVKDETMWLEGMHRMLMWNRFCSSHSTFALDFWSPAPSFHQSGNCRARSLHSSSCGAFAPWVGSESAFGFSKRPGSIGFLPSVRTPGQVCSANHNGPVTA